MKNSLDPKIIIGAVGGLVVLIVVIIVASASRKPAAVTETQKQNVRLQVESHLQDDKPK